jgi:sulfoxide reductase heme-binding subunit YedZ
MVLLGRLKDNWLRILVHAGALAPLAWLAWKYAQGAFLIDPVREITTFTGKGALILLVLSLSATPVATLSGWRRGLCVRRALGLYALVYAGLHFLTFSGLDYAFDLNLLGQAILDQRYVMVGIASGLILLALAVTSTRGWQKRLGQGWKRLHRLSYLAGMLAILHFLWLVKDPREPLRYAGLLAALLVLRIPPVRKAVSNLRRRFRLAERLRRRFGATANSA